MADLLLQVVQGLSLGAVYAGLALALVLVHRFTGIVNFAQGELAMLSTYVAWQLLDAGMPFWAAFPVTLAVSVAGGMLVERLVIRRVEGGGELTLVAVTVGLLIFVNAAAGLVWSFAVRSFPNPFPTALGFGSAQSGFSALGVLGVVAVVMLALHVLFRHTGAGLVMRAVVADPVSARLAGIRVGRVLGLGWGLAAGVGAVAGVLVAPLLFLEPNMMGGVLVYALAAAVLGGFRDPVVTVAAGLGLGVAATLAGTYVEFVGADLKVAVPLLVIVTALLLPRRAAETAGQR
ncbi:branched-chain amino acid ABC transporter permease [Planomonospora venezuelensis]|uniref:Branched-chain amino acid transport system permease protein n=1 Tax=Planomonospora venezuelensis TaxID=1999 RepID=A0A841D639_PLAVE|nr:branched-chain amino acid ABC transporter permease [Planomonospora venezuelensis]MBB5966112.1 branched-chain amino acid transport system permease protein [Planomonospora venezuelensis]GIN04640.1 branched-chain amino acid ABC transporter permease [Planomonospora venezuelensis]